MSISTKEDFVKLVDKMLGIIYTENEVSKKINDLINTVCSDNKLMEITDYTLNYAQEKVNPEKILPCNNKKSLIDKNIIIKSGKNSGGSSIVYNNKIDGKKFKATIRGDIYESLFGYIFEYFLYQLIKKPNYLCKTYEIGKFFIDNQTYFYTIMDNCGDNLLNFFKKKSNSTNRKSAEEINILFNNLLIIFNKMILCVKIVHDLGYAHLDIKPENLLISSNDNSNLLDLIFTKNIENIVLIKIIDFELVRKIGCTINIEKPGIGTVEYSHPDLLTGISKNIEVKSIYDIEMLRKSFIYIIGIIFLDSNLYKSDKFKQRDKFNEQISKILEELNKLIGDNKPDKLDQLLTILSNIKEEKIYTNIDFLFYDIFSLININFTEKFKSTNNTLTIDSVKTKLNKKSSEFTIIPISKYYSSLCSLKLLKINAIDISLNLYEKIQGQKILASNNYKEENKPKNNEKIPRKKIQNKIKESLTKYLLPEKDIITGYIIDEHPTKITYFRKITDTKYISLKTYFEKIFSSKDENEYIKLTHVLYIFSLIMDCIQLFEYLLDYGLNVLLDNFIIHNDTTLFTLDIDLKIVGGIVNTKIDTRSIQILGNELFDILSKFSFFISDKVKIKNTNNIQTKLNKLINIKKKKETSLFFKKTVNQKDIYRTELSEIIETMIFKSIDIMTLIGKFKEIRKTIYLNEILDKYEEISMSKKTEVKRTKINKEIFSRKINLDTSKYKEKDCTLERCMFGFLLYSYIYYFYKSQIKYLCEVAKITFKTDKQYYSSINNNCGTSLSEYFSNITVNSSNNKTIIFNNILKIFYEMLCCIEILHESGFLCVKPSENIFVIDTKQITNIKKTNLIDDNNLVPPQKLLVKIVDFSSVRKIGFEIKDTNIFDSSTEKPNNWSKFSKEWFSKFKLTPYHDIFLLGQLFKDILTSKKIDETVYEKSSFKTIIDRMCNKDPSKGYQDIDSLIIDFGYLLKKENTKPINTSNHIIKTEENYTIYYDGILLPYIKDTALNKRYPITKDIIKKLAKKLDRSELKEITQQKLKELLNRKYRNFNTLSKITRKKIDKLNPNKKTFNKYTNNLSKQSKLKNLLDTSTNNLNNVFNTDYIKYNATDGKYKSATIKSILDKLTKEDIEKIIKGTFLEKVESNKPSVDFGLENIFFILVRILFKKQNSESNNGKFYDSIYKKYRGKNEFILEIIYELLCEKFTDEIDNSNPNIKKLINNLKRINFLPYSFRYKKKNNSTVNKNSITDLNEKEDLFRKISPEKFQKGQNYFYELNEKSILYFGKLENIEGGLLVSKTYIFKYYIGSDNLCDIIELSAAELQGLKFYEFNVTSQSNTKTLRRESSMFNGFNGLFSSINFGSSWSKVVSFISSDNSAKLINIGNKLLTHNDDIIIRPYESDKSEKNIGLKNCGNMCYAIAVIQFLYHNDSIRNGILSLNINSLDKEKILSNLTQISSAETSIDKHIIILKCIKYIFYLFQITSSNTDIIDLCDNGIFPLLHSLIIKNGKYKEQEDAYEFLGQILSKFNDLNLDFDYNFSLQTKYTTNNGSKEKINQKYKVNKITKMDDIQNICLLDISNISTQTIQELFNIYLNPEVIDEKEKLPDNKRNIYDNKIVSIISSKKNIFILLKRFGNQKIVQPIEINSSITFKVNDVDKTYKINGIICHLGGTADSGHYVYYKFIDKDNVICFNDNKVTMEKYEKSVKSNIEKHCYILQYNEDLSSVMTKNNLREGQPKEIAIKHKYLENQINKYVKKYSPKKGTTITYLNNKNIKNIENILSQIHKNKNKNNRYNFLENVKQELIKKKELIEKTKLAQAKSAKAKDKKKK